MIINYYYYKFIFFIRYTLIGFSSIILELILYNIFKYYNFTENIALITSLLIGIIFAFFGNIKFNFKIDNSKKFRAFQYFLFISISSWLVQYVISINFKIFDYEQSRIIISGCVFVIFYLLHRKYSFKDIKRVGIAIYLNQKENINLIFKKIKDYPDFLHIDIVDNTFNQNANENDIKLMKQIKKLWPKKEIHFHIMSSNPMFWINKIIKYADLIYIHWEINEDIKPLINIIKKNKIKVGVALKLETDPLLIKAITPEIDSILLMSIENIGQSGNTFNETVINKITKIKNNLNLLNIRLCADGGIGENVIMNINCEDVVSGSFVLQSKNPKLDIIRLKTSTQYEIL